MRISTSVPLLLRVAAWACIFGIGVLSLLPHDEIEPIRSGYYGLGLTAEHAVAYTIAMAAVGLAYGERLALWRLGAALVTYGALLEVGQLLVPGRTAQLIDVAEDAVGVIAGVMLLMILRAAFAWWRSPQPRSA